MNRANGRVTILAWVGLWAAAIAGCGQEQPADPTGHAAHAVGMPCQTDAQCFGTTCCNGFCADTTSDPSNCGACNIACPSGATCSAGSCTCSGLQTLCGGACVDTSVDNNNCGSCGSKCMGGLSCQAPGNCACGGHLTQCGTTCIDVSTDTHNCGDCGVVCPPNALCQGGTCMACPTGQVACGNFCVANSPPPVWTWSTPGQATIFTVPNCVTTITVKAWGAGGGGGGMGAGGGAGGGGGYATSTLAVTPGQRLTIISGGGGGGAANGCVAGTGGGAGGAGANGIGAGGRGGDAGPVPCDAAGGGGGGGSFVIDANNNILVAAGGGGGGGGYESWGCNGLCGAGGGGGVSAPDVNTGWCPSGKLTGGVAGASPDTNGLAGPHDANDGPGAGGGGGGLRGGGGGNVDDPCDNYPTSGGGGGTNLGQTVMSGSATVPGNAGDPQRGSFGDGGSSLATGNNGGVVISWCGNACAPLSTDKQWRMATVTPPPGWQNLGFDDSSWVPSIEEGSWGTGPWGQVQPMPTNATPAKWIWYYDSRNASDFATVYFRRTFSVPATPLSLTMTADNAYDAWIDGVHFGIGANWPTCQQYTLTLTAGAHVIAIQSVNWGGPGGQLVDVR